MKQKRIILHIAILLLAVMCIGAGMYIGYWNNRGIDNNFLENYNSSYVEDVNSILEYKQAQIKFSDEFGDENKILIENKTLGNVTVKDIEAIFSEKYSSYYYSDVEWGDYSDYEESFDYEESVSDDILYQVNNSLMKKYKKEYKKNPSKENKDYYTYYKTKIDYVDEYADLTEILLQAVRNDGSQIKDFSPNTLIYNTYPAVTDGMKYYLKYTLNKEVYILTNNADKKELKPEELSDITQAENGDLVQNEPAYGTKDFRVISFNLETGDELYVGIDAKNTNSTYYSMMKQIEKHYITNDKKEQIRKNETICIGIITGTLIVALIFYILLIVLNIRGTKGKTPKLYSGDKIWLDLEVVVVASVTLGIMSELTDVFNQGYCRYTAIIGAVLLLLVVEYVLYASESLVRRLTTKSFLKTTLIGKIVKGLRYLAIKIKNGCHNIINNLSLMRKVSLLGAILFIWQMLLTYIYWCTDILMPLIMAVIATVIICYMIWKYLQEKQLIQEGAEKIAAGDIEFKIDDDMKFTSNNRMKECVNGIGEGINKAVAESIKNERMKTELIANVSHDLKTPLTSIINYVDLLKTDGVDSEQAEKYLDVLDKKSQRLKQLTEDLVEVSKLNSGVVKLELEKLDIVQLIKQSLGEYEEKFGKKKLQVVKNIMSEPLYVMADGRRTWRLFENLYENVYKYAMEGTRVYIDVKQEKSNVIISIKNISNTPLNFDAEELMERFVRGDSARTTEGSGLGLSIASSIAQQQNGKLEIVLDGDLFKVEIEMNLINE